ncbi:MAG: TetR/AcrR family transcriptional regulator [Clostridia bacterium]
MQKGEATKQHLLELAKAEFLKKGYSEASVRNIAKTAGLTTGAVFRYFPDKVALFDALVSDAADTLMNQFKAAQDAHFDLIPEEKTTESLDLSTEYLNHFINYIYDNFDAFKLVICCSEGTRYANYIHDLVELEVSQTEVYYEKLRQLGKLEGSINHDLHHMITSAYFTAVFETVAHDMDRERAIEYVNELAAFFNYGWNGLLRLI